MEKHQKNREVFIRRLLMVFAFFLLLLLAFDKVSFGLVLAVIALTLLYAFGREKIWMILATAIPALIFGEIFYIPISTGWIYEARLTEIFLVMVFAVYLLDAFLNDRFRDVKINRLCFLLYLLLIISMLSLGRALDFRLYVFGLKAVAYSFLGYFLAVNLLNSTKKIYWFLYGLVITAIILSSQVFFKFYQMGFSSDFFFNRSSITVPIGPIATSAAILALIAPILLAFYFELPNIRRWKPIVFLGFFMSFLAVFLTLGKGAIGSLFIGLFYIFYNFRNKRLAFFLFLIWFLALAYFGFTPFFSGLIERMQTTFVDANTSYRITEYEVGWNLVKNHPIIGNGIGQQIYYFQKALDQERGNYVNNFIFQILIDFGVIGIFILVFVMKYIFDLIRKTWGQKGQKSVLAVGFVSAILVAFFNGMVEVTFYAVPYAIIFWMIVGVFGNIIYSKNS